MHPAYRIHPETLIHEFSCFYQGISNEVREKMDKILRNLEMARSLCEEGTIYSTGFREKIAEILGSLGVLAPLYGLFQDLQDGTECDCGENFSTKNPCEAMLAPLKICIDLLTHVYHLPSISRPHRATFHPGTPSPLAGEGRGERKSRVSEWKLPN
jgi:hypothetical protein